MFADAATGPHSGALVSQGRIGALIAAKPAERRLLLDEAAGTAGLHARRHEAELKLQAAETNLVRLDDVIATLAAQIETLRKQARQAQRYRRLGEQIRHLEARLLAVRWRVAATEGERVATELRAAERAVAAGTEAALTEQRRRAEAEAALPGLRMTQAEAAAGLQRLSHAREALWPASSPRAATPSAGAISSGPISGARASTSPMPMPRSPGSPRNSTRSNATSLRPRRHAPRLRNSLTLPRRRSPLPKPDCSR